MDTKKRDKPKPTPDSKTIGPETYEPNAVRRYELRDDPPDVHVRPANIGVTQAELAQLAEDEAMLDSMEKDITARKEAILQALLGGVVVEIGVFTASTKPNFKRQGVNWRQMYIDEIGEEMAQKLEAQAKAQAKEINSYSLVVGRTDGK